MKNRRMLYSVGIILILIIWAFLYQKRLKILLSLDSGLLSPSPLDENPTLVTLNQTDTELSTSSFNLQDLRAFAIQLTVSSPDANYKHLLELERILKSLSSLEATYLITAYFKTHEDALTQLDFALSPEGYLETAPTLRTFLLDQIAEINPQAAVVLAKEILETPISADEWAIAIRNYAWGQPNRDVETDVYFNQKVDELLNNKEWLKSPSAGFLQAFDAVVYTNNQKFAIQLAAIASDPDSPVATKYAANLAGIRMAEQDFVATATTLTHDSQLPQDSKFRSTVMTHADFSNEAAVPVIIDYLSTSTISAEEKKRFLEGFPNIVDVYSNNLLTRQVSKSLELNEISDLKALELFKQLREDPAYGELYSALDIAIKRLEEFAASLARGKAQENLRTLLQ